MTVTFEDFIETEPPVTDDVESLDDDFTCDICGKVSKNARGLSMHKKRSHDVSSASDSQPKSLRKSNLEKELTEFFQMIAMIVSMINVTDGQILGSMAERNAHAWANLARQNKPIENFLRGVMKTGAMGEVVGATMFTIAPILANHGKLPRELMMMFGGIVPTDADH